MPFFIWGISDVVSIHYVPLNAKLQTLCFPGCFRELYPADDKLSDWHVWKNKHIISTGLIQKRQRSRSSRYDQISLTQTFLVSVVGNSVHECEAALSASLQVSCGAMGQFPSAFGCHEGNQLWQSCKLFLWRAFRLGVHALSLPPYLYQGPVGSCGPLIRQAYEALAMQYQWHQPQKEVV